jgi:hypothetical protein
MTRIQTVRTLTAINIGRDSMKINSHRMLAIIIDEGIPQDTIHILCKYQFKILSGG